VAAFDKALKAAGGEVAGSARSPPKSPEFAPSIQRVRMRSQRWCSCSWLRASRRRVHEGLPGPRARHGVLAQYLKPHHFAIGSIKLSDAVHDEIHLRPVHSASARSTDGQVSQVFSCFNQNQPLDCVDFQALSERLRQNSLQEKLTAHWIAQCMPRAAPRPRAYYSCNSWRRRMNAAECLLSVGADDAVALQCGDERITYGELRDAVRCTAGAWRSLGLDAGTRVVVFAPDSIDWVIAYLGVIWAGGVAIGANPRLGLADLAPIVADSEVRYIWCEADASAGVCAMAKTLPIPPAVVSAGNGMGLVWSATLRTAAGIEASERQDEDPALWIGTSGTTGIPKGVVHAHRVALGPHSFAQRVLHLTRDDRLYATSKLFFAYALANSLFAGLRLGATVILDRDRPTPERVRAVVARHRPTILFTVPTLYNKMVQEGVAPALRGCGIQHFMSAGEAMPNSVRNAWAVATGQAPISGYGTSETLSLVLYCDDDSGLLRPTPLTSVRYVDGSDPHAPQRIWIRNSTLALGYWRRPGAQAEGFRGGWFSPGDTFLRRSEDRLEFTGRQDDMLKVAGQWVSTIWIEHALAEAGGDAIDQVAAIGVPTREGLTTISVLAVALPGREDDARRRLDAAIDRLPQHRRPCWVYWVSELPVTATGKLQRSRLRDAHESALSSKEVG